MATLPTVALLGTGLMGAKMACRLASLGYDVCAWNRSAEKAQRLADKGVHPCRHAAAAVGRGSIVLLMLADAAAIRSTILEDAAVRGELQGKTVLQMGTIGPKESEALAHDIQAAGAAYVEAPVLGSQPEAEKGTLLIMVGAEADPRAAQPPPAYWPLLLALGQEPNIHYIGPVGTAAAVKLALNQLIASLTVGFSASLGLVRSSGAPVESFMSILRASALYAPTYDKKLQKMLDRDYGAANFPTKHLLKDVRLFESEAGQAGLDTSVQQALSGVILRAMGQGLQDCDYSAVYEGVNPPEGQGGAEGREAGGEA